MGKNDHNIKRELILTAAADVFYEKGFHNATVEEIAKRADIGKGTIYQYFSSKQEILVEMLHEKFGAYTGSLQKSIQENDSAYQNMQRLVNAHFNELDMIHRFASGLFQAGSNPNHCGTPVNDVLQAYKKQVTECFEKLILLGQEKGELCQGDVSLMAAAMLGALTGISYWLIEKNGFQQKNFDWSILSESIAKVMLAGLEGNR